MSKAKLTTIVIGLVLLGSSLYAKPMLTANSELPVPQGGYHALEKNATYPLWAKNQKISGSVVLNFHVDKEGNISNMHIEKSSGNMFDQSAINAVMNTKWKPAMQAGRPVAVNYALPFEYRAK